MATGTIDHKCPNCYATLKFDPHGQNWACEYCRSTFNKEDIDKYEKIRNSKVDKDVEEVKLDKDENGMDIYTCPNCGAQIVADEETTATFCVYCKSTAILKNKFVGEFNPRYVIPFHTTNEDAIEAFKNIGKGKAFMPKLFNDKQNIEEIKGVYIPFWLYDMDTHGTSEGTATKVRHWQSGDYAYTKTDTYHVAREATMHFENIPVDGSTRFDDDVMNSIEPFNYDGLIDFDASYLAGFLAEKYDVDSETAYTIAQDRAVNTIYDELRQSIKGYDSVTLPKKGHSIEKTGDDYALLPVWMVNIKYNGKMHLFAMNGQTGKLIGDVPIDKKKVVIWWIGIFIIVAIVASLIWYFFGGGI